MNRTMFAKEAIKFRNKVTEKLGVELSDLTVPEYSYGVTKSYIVSTFVHLIKPIMIDIMQAVENYPGVSKDWLTWSVDSYLEISIIVRIDPKIKIDENYKKRLEDLLSEFAGEETEIIISSAGAHTIVIQLDIKNKELFRKKQKKNLKDVIDSINVTDGCKEYENEIRESVFKELI